MDRNALWVRKALQRGLAGCQFIKRIENLYYLKFHELPLILQALSIQLILRLPYKHLEKEDGLVIYARTAFTLQSDAWKPR